MAADSKVLPGHKRCSAALQYYPGDSSAAHIQCGGWFDWRAC
eukprot:COSAG06_NODE_1768_length_8432_cov_5.547822_3_plen_42_part_00